VNARDAMPKGGVIAISAQNRPDLRLRELHGDYVCVSVTDSGTGMTEEVKARVFEPFFTTKEVGKGSGLGLAQVYGFVKQSRGSVAIDTEVGRGTTVTVYLPRATQPPSDETVDAVDVPALQEGEPAGSVLLVEDNDEVAALVTDMLRQLGYEVMRAATARAALGALENERRVDLVFSDIMMPGPMDGIDLAREIRARRRELPVLLTSGFTDANLRRADAEGLRILPKPYTLDDLRAALLSM
jgi:CheY-like chemotaxis protein